jgi:hypothetical protein
MLSPGWTGLEMKEVRDMHEGSTGHVSRVVVPGTEHGAEALVGPCTEVLYPGSNAWSAGVPRS